MGQEDAKQAILKEWHLWAAATSSNNAKGADGLLFFEFLQKERYHLLTFRAPGDKWQVIHSWLLRAKLVSD